MDKAKLNFVIDALMFLCLMAMAGLGFLMHYILPPGRRVHAVYGRNVDLTWLGWDRHDWGDIHLYLAFTLLGLLTVHLILHWSMIVGLFARLLPDPKLRHSGGPGLFGDCSAAHLLPLPHHPGGGGKGPGRRPGIGPAALPGGRLGATAGAGRTWVGAQRAVPLGTAGKGEGAVKGGSRAAPTGLIRNQRVERFSYERSGK